MFEQVDAPIGGSLGWSALGAVLPLATLFVLLAGLRMPAWRATLIALAVALLVAVAGYGMPVGQAIAAATEGAAFGLFPILWIVVNAVWIFQMTVASGHFDVLRRCFAAVSTDQRVQAVLIGFCVGALLEGLAGFGAPVAICAVLLLAVGLRPLRAASVALVANTAPVAYGAVGVPISTLAETTGLPADDLAAMVGRQLPILAVAVPFALVAMVDGRRGLAQAWPAALAAGGTFALVEYLMANFGSLALTAIVAALAAAAAVIVTVRWRPPEPARAGIAGSGHTGPDDTAAGAGPEAPTVVIPRIEEAPGAAHRDGPPATVSGPDDTAAERGRAFAPYLLVIALFTIQQLPPVQSALDAVTLQFGWPGLRVLDPAGQPVAATEFTLNWLATPGTILLLAGVGTAALLGLTARATVRVYGATVRQLGPAIATVTAALALGYVLNLSGQTPTLGLWLAEAGGAFAVLAPILGWLGTAVTGSNTSSNALFGQIQVSAAGSGGLSPVLLAAANSSGGVFAKMISVQNLAIAASVGGLDGREGDIFRRVIGWSLLFLLALCLLVGLQSTLLLDWMVPTP